MNCVSECTKKGSKASADIYDLIKIIVRLCCTFRQLLFVYHGSNPDLSDGGILCRRL